ncbi:hypothetical protein [Nocardioides sp. URHA0032]|uniref:hypothetical protein n=1 Tax=Nocardioides sp. URHA0032 TaxID=1380388 RepID=UPI00048A5698|nr:hypothetical protein [Nocardioides sp. URHA0032]
MTEDYVHAAQTLRRILNSSQVREALGSEAGVAARPAELEQVQAQVAEAASSPALRRFMENYTRLQQQLVEVRRTEEQTGVFLRSIDQSTIDLAVEVARVADQAAADAGQSAWSRRIQKVVAALQPPLDARFSPWERGVRPKLKHSAPAQTWDTTDAQPAFVPIETLEDLQQIADAADVPEEAIQQFEAEISDIAALDVLLDDAADQIGADHPSITRAQARRLVLVCAYAGWVLSILGITVLSDPVLVAVAARLGATGADASDVSSTAGKLVDKAQSKLVADQRPSIAPELDEDV